MIKHDNTLLVVEQPKTLLSRNPDSDLPEQGQGQGTEQEGKNEHKWLKLNPNHDM